MRSSPCHQGRTAGVRSVRRPSASRPATGEVRRFATFLDRVSRGYRAAYRVRTFAVGDEISRKTARRFIPPVPSLAAGPTGKARGAGDPDANPTIIPAGPAPWSDGAEVADRRCSGFIDGSELDMIEGAS